MVFARQWAPTLGRCLSLWLVIASAAVGQPGNPFRPEPFRDPEEFFQKLFGEESPEDRAKIEKVPIALREEQQVGTSAANQFLRYLKREQIAVEDDGTDVAYLRQLVRGIHPLMTNSRRYRKIQVLLADSPRVDARSFPGGTIVVFRGLIDFCENEAALAGILGHELSHIDRGHQLYYLRRWKYAQQTWSSGFDPRRMMATTEMMAKMFMRPFRPEEEAEADRDGARWAFQLGYDARQMADVFLRLSQQASNRGAARLPFLQSHPANEDRYRAIVQQHEELVQKQPDAPQYVGRTNIQRRTPRSKQEFAE